MTNVAAAAVMTTSKAYQITEAPEKSGAFFVAFGTRCPLLCHRIKEDTTEILLGKRYKNVDLV